MLLYYSPGACSLAGHIALIEADMKFDIVKVDLAKHVLEDGRSFFEINPKGYVPVLQLDDGKLLTENIAVLSYIADQYPALSAPGAFGKYRLLETLAFISTEIHKAFKPLFTSDATQEAKTAAGQQVEKRLELLAGQFQGPFIFGRDLTAADCYLFVMLLWANKHNLKVPQVFTAFADHMRSRPAVSVALKQEGLQ
jgi:glutathione S-transferase